MIAQINYNICLSRNGYQRRDGRRSVVVELYQPGTGLRRVVSTGVRVAPQDFAYGRVQPSEADHDLLNRRLRRIVRTLMELEDEMLDQRREPTPQRLVDAYRHHQTPSATVTEWVAAVVEGSQRREVTKRMYRTVVASLETFMPGLRLRQLTYDVVTRWQQWMTAERGLCANTVALRLKALRCLVNEAVRRDVLHADDDPFRRIRIGEITPRREHLTADELQALEAYSPEEERLRRVRDAFLFCCYTGLRWGDFAHLTASAVSEETDGVRRSESERGGGEAVVLTLRQRKTGGTVRLPLHLLFGGRALTILRQYAAVEALAAVGTNSRCNGDLRRIALAAGIKKCLHWHMARHTCATLLNQQGLRMQEIQYILGHRRQATTERHYAETTYSQVEAALARTGQSSTDYASALRFSR